MPERGSKTSMVPVVWATFGMFSLRRDPNDFLSLLVTMEETWLYHNYPETKQQSMEWRHRAHPPQKIPSAKKPLENFSPRFFGIKTSSSPLITFQRTTLTTRSITHLCWCKRRTFWMKNAAGRSRSGVLFLHDNAQAHRALTTQKKLAYPGFQCRNHPPYSPDLAP